MAKTLPDDLCEAEELAELLRCSVKTIYRRVKNGDFPKDSVLKFGRMMRFRPEKIIDGGLNNYNRARVMQS